VRFIDRRNVGEISSGLWASPQRQEVLAAMEADLIDPDFVVTEYWLDRLIWLAAETKSVRARLATREILTPVSGTPQQSANSSAETLYPELSQALEHKRGQPATLQ